MSIGERIANLRKKNKMSQQDLANRLFVTNKTISSWEQNRTEPDLKMVGKLSKILSCSPSYLIHGDNSTNGMETEIKIKLTDYEFRNLELLMKKDGIFMTEVEHKDTYYEPTYRKFSKDNIINEWLRIGRRGNKNILTYKKMNGIYRDEYEVEIDNIDNLNKIFNALELKEIAVVHKIRKIYMYLDKYEVSLDNVKEVGYFIEVEVKNYDQSIREEYDDLLKVIKDLNLKLDRISKRSYLDYLLNNNLD